jgi:hypothetical protein
MMVFHGFPSVNNRAVRILSSFPFPPFRFHRNIESIILFVSDFNNYFQKTYLLQKRTPKPFGPMLVGHIPHKRSPGFLAAEV